MKIKTIKKVLDKKFEDWVVSINDGVLRDQVKKNSIITGGCIASMLLREEVNDFDIYFRDRATCVAVAQYYVNLFRLASGVPMRVDVNEEGRVRVMTNKSEEKDKPDFCDRGETVILDPGEIEDTHNETEQKALNTEDEKDKPPFRPLYITTNAITLSHKVQLVLRFYGEPDEIHKNYDFVHCTNYWTSWDSRLTLRQEALEAILSKELRYVGSKYPVCSVIRLRKFIARQWTINAGQILKMLMQVSELDLTDPKVLEDQLTGVDCAYFASVIEKLKDKDPEKINIAYLVEIIDRIF